MKIKIASTRLAAAVKQATSVVKAKDATDPFAFVGLTADEGKLTVLGANFSASVGVVVPCEVHEAGGCSLYGKHFASFSSAIPGGLAELSAKDSGGKASLDCEGVRFTLAALANGVKPVEVGEHVASFAVAGLVLKEVIRKISPAISTEETRRGIQGILFESDGSGTVKAVATDGRRLHYILFEVDTSAAFRFVLRPEPASTISALIAEDDTVTVEIGANGIGFATDDWFVRANLPTDPFPNYRQVIPAEGALTTSVKIDRVQLKETVSRAVLAAVAEFSSVKLVVKDGEVSISSRNGDACSMIASVVAKVTGEGMTLNMNAKLVLDALNAIADDQVEFFCADGKPVLVKCAVPFLAVIMPLIIS